MIFKCREERCWARAFAKVVWLQSGNLVGGGGEGQRWEAQEPDHPGPSRSWERATALEVEKRGWTCSRQKREDLRDTAVGGGTIAPFRVQEQRHLTDGAPAGGQTLQPVGLGPPHPTPRGELDKYLLN